MPLNSSSEKPVFSEERKMEIVGYISQQGSVTVAELCDRFGVSPATIRNDLRDLEKLGRIMRTHGGAMRRERTGFETPLESRSVENIESKKIVAQLALECIENGDTVIMDVGTTTFEFAKALAGRFNIYVVTNDLKIASLADEYPEIDMYVLGGKVRAGYHCSLGASTVRALNDIAADRVFMGTNGFEPGYGASTPNSEHAEVKRAMMKAAKKNYILCDSSKMGRRALIRFASIEEIDVLIIDRISQSDKQKLEEAGIEVHTAKTY